MLGRVHGPYNIYNGPWDCRYATKVKISPPPLFKKMSTDRVLVGSLIGLDELYY